MKILIRKGDETQLSTHFKAAEFFSNKPSSPASHDFYTELVEAVEFLRGWYDTPWRITSTYRPESPGSQHQLCRAVDSQPSDRSPVVLADLHQQLLNPKSEVFRTLRGLGINGFGLYDTFIHLDVRDVTKFSADHSDRFGRFGFWDNRKKKVKAPTVKPSPKKPTLSPAPTSRALPGASSSSR